MSAEIAHPDDVSPLVIEALGYELLALAAPPRPVPMALKSDSVTRLPSRANAWDSSQPTAISRALGERDVPEERFG